MEQHIEEIEGLPEDFLALNLGCGENHLPQHVNVDKHGNPDLKWDLEVFPWPWEDNSVNCIMLNHCLEHLGELTDVYLKIWQEMYRVLQDGGVIRIVVPHPHHDDFINDPTHVRRVTPPSVQLFNKELNRAWVEAGYSNSPLGLYLDIDFRIVDCEYVPTESFREKWAGVEDRDRLEELMHREAATMLNIVKEIRMTVVAVKPPVKAPPCKHRNAYHNVKTATDHCDTCGAVRGSRSDWTVPE